MDARYLTPSRRRIFVEAALDNHVMHDLKNKTIELMNTPTGRHGTMAGPSFEYAKLVFTVLADHIEDVLDMVRLQNELIAPALSGYRHNAG